MTGTTDPRQPVGRPERPKTPAEERKERFDREADEQIERFEQRWDYQRY